MRGNRANAVLRYLRRVAAAECPLADRELLDRFVTRRDQTAYAALVGRHGPMVLRLCLRVLHNQHDAEDAFQATFFVLSQKAASLRPQRSLSGWLYSVAYRIAQKARIDAARRRKHEGRAASAQAVDPLDQISLREAYAVLDKELARLPDKFRVPLVLCYLEGLTRDEAAQQLGLPASTLKGRLDQARERLRTRLAARGLALAGPLVAGVFSEGTASAALPSMLLNSTVDAAIAVAAGEAAASVVPAPVAALAEGVIKAMFMTKLKMATALLLAVASIGTAMRMAQVKAASPRPDENPAPQPAAASVEGKAAVVDGLRQQVQEQTWYVIGVDAAGNSISLQTQPSGAAIALTLGSPPGSGTTAEAKEASSAVRKVIVVDDATARLSQEFNRAYRAVSRLASGPSGIAIQMGVAEDAQIFIDGQQRSLADVQPGMQVSLQMAQDRSAIARINASAPGKATIVGMDVEKRTITVSVGGQEWTAPLADTAKVTIVGSQDAQLSDLSAGMWVRVQLGVDSDKIVVTSILAGSE